MEKYHHNQRHEFKVYLDHFLYTVPKEPVNWRYFTFPSTNVGQQGVYEAYRFLYQDNEFFRNWVSEDSIHVSDNNHQEIVEQLVQQQRNKLREQNQLTEDHQVFFLAPGNAGNDVTI